MKRRFAVYCITKHGVTIAESLVHTLKIDCEIDVYLSSRLDGIGSAELRSHAKHLGRPMGPTLSKTWSEYDCHIHLISVGAVVRMISGLMASKKTDPAVVCVDERARFSIAVLSGHVGRGNEDAFLVAGILDAEPVITTASDTLGTLTVDILGRDLGWRLADADRNVTAGCASVVNHEPVLFVQECGESNWWPLDKSLPPGVQYATSFEGVDPKAWSMLLVVTDRELDQLPEHVIENSVIYRPPSLVLGIGCDRNTSPEMMERGVAKVLLEAGLSIDCVDRVATIDVKGDEPAILQLVERHGWKLTLYPAADLNGVHGVENPSEVVRKYVGTDSVGEAACLLSSGAERLALPKTKYTESDAGRNMTLSVARIPYAPRATKTANMASATPQS